MMFFSPSIDGDDEFSRRNAMVIASRPTAGALDPTFGNGGKVFPVYPPDPVGYTSGFSVAPDGKLVLAGIFGEDYAITRLEADGSPDTSFGQGGIVTGKFEKGFRSRGSNIVLLDDGKILLTGLAYLSKPELALARHHPNGSLDTQFGDQGIVLVRFPRQTGEDATQAQALEGQSGHNSADRAIRLPDGKILLTSNQPEALLARLNLDGTFDTSFNNGRGFTVVRHPDYVIQIATQLLQPDGKILVAGHAYRSGESLQNVVIARYHADGALDQGFGDSGFFLIKQAVEHQYLLSLALQDNGNIIACGGTAAPIGRSAKCLLLSVTASGTFDPLFNKGQPLVTEENNDPNGFEWRSVATQSDTKIVVQGHGLGPQADVILRRFSAFGVPDLTFGDATGLVRTPIDGAMAESRSMGLDGSRIVVTGAFYPDGHARPFVLRYLS
jgi:uncharacterized delta-60 repeat protein